jgi:hypothetical protein
MKAGEEREERRGDNINDFARRKVETVIKTAA